MVAGHLTGRNGKKFFLDEERGRCARGRLENRPARKRHNKTLLSSVKVIALGMFRGTS